MSVQAILLPLFVQVALTLGLCLWLGRARVGAIRRGEIRIGDTALGQAAWPGRIGQIANSYRNQFEMPVLFYLAVVVAMATAKADLAFVVLSWLFVASRVVHAAIHTGANDVRRRFVAFVAGVVVLTAMWLLVAGRILLAY